MNSAVLKPLNRSVRFHSSVDKKLHFGLTDARICINICFLGVAHSDADIEPIVGLTYGENRANYGSTSGEYGSHPVRENPDEFKKHEVLMPRPLVI